MGRKIPTVAGPSALGFLGDELNVARSAVQESATAQTARKQEWKRISILERRRRQPYCHPYRHRRSTNNCYYCCVVVVVVGGNSGTVHPQRKRARVEPGPWCATTQRIGGEVVPPPWSSCPAWNKATPESVSHSLQFPRASFVSMMPFVICGGLTTAIYRATVFLSAVGCVAFPEDSTSNGPYGCLVASLFDKDESNWLHTSRLDWSSYR